MLENFTPLANPSVLCKTVDDGWSVLINLDTHHSMAINPTTSIIWEAIDGKRDIPRIIDYVKTHFSDPPKHIENDVDEILELFLNQGYIGKETKWTI